MCFRPSQLHKNPLSTRPVQGLSLARVHALSIRPEWAEHVSPAQPDLMGTCFSAHSSNYQGPGLSGRRLTAKLTAQTTFCTPLAGEVVWAQKFSEKTPPQHYLAPGQGLHLPVGKLRNQNPTARGKLGAQGSSPSFSKVLLV